MVNVIAFSLSLCLFFTISCAKDINFTSCGGEVMNVNVDPCDEEPCTFPRGGSVTITTKCISNANAEKLKLTVYAYLSGIEVPYPGMKRNACINKNITCPIEEGQEIEYVQVFPVKSFFPKVDTETKFDLVTNDQQDKVVCCFQTPVRVV